MVSKVIEALAQAGVGERHSILVGVSGGADSMGLLHALCALRAMGRLREVCAAHLNHSIRGEEADRDEAFVAVTCLKADVPLYRAKEDIPALAKRQKRNVEDAARAVRYAFLERARLMLQADFIAVAHHMDDQAETVLLHLIRGAGLSGLSAMRLRSGLILRPLLGVSKAEILAYLQAERVEYCLDSTNLDEDIARNRVRLELLPLLRKNYNPAITKSLSCLAGLCGEDEAYLVGVAQTAIEAARQPDGGFACEGLIGLPMPVKSRVVRRILEEHGALYGMQRPGILRIVELMSAHTGKSAPLPDGRWAFMSYGRLYIGQVPKMSEWAVPLFMDGQAETNTPLGRFAIRAAKTLVLGEGPFVAYLDADRLPGPFLARNRQPGDQLHPLGAPGRKKLKDYYIDHKVPPNRREGPIVLSGEVIVFLPGHTIAHAFRVQSDTKRILRLEFFPKGN